MNSFKDTLKTFASYTMAASTILLITATMFGAIVATLDEDDEDPWKGEPEEEKE